MVKEKSCWLLYIHRLSLSEFPVLYAGYSSKKKALEALQKLSKTEKQLLEAEYKCTCTTFWPTDRGFHIRRDDKTLEMVYITQLWLE